MADRDPMQPNESFNPAAETADNQTPAKQKGDVENPVPHSEAPEAAPPASEPKSGPGG